MAAMPRPLRLAAPVALVALASLACGGESVAPSRSPVGTTAPAPTATVSPAAASPTETRPAVSPTPAAEGTVRLPRDAPRTFDRFVDAEDVPPEALAPPGAVVGSRWTGVVETTSRHATAPALAFTWSRGDPAAPESGLEVWIRSDTTEQPPWRVVFAFTDPPRAGVLGVRFETADVTHDRSTDLLSFESQGGSGACGVWRVISMHVETVDEIYRVQACDTEVRIAGGDLAVREAVYRPDDAHCCPSAYRTTTSRWTGRRWNVVSTSTTPA
jgi:hypothetical protein